jgi:hypothetical protein
VDPRETDNESQTGTGTPRSGDEARPGGEAVSDDVTSHPADADELHVNRSGSGGTGGPSTVEGESEGSTPESMDELLGGTREDPDR